tara:strand:+ start:16 stop:741 length:726 start_codon:yes stop_codon:yes gene_type:complete
MQLNLSPDASIVILTGAGISKESGLDTFRDADGIWSKVNLEDVATPEGYLRNPVMVHAFYNARRRSLMDSNVVPNAAHAALAKLEQAWQGNVLLVTQNIDDLHERAGSSKLLHMHGEMLKARCERTGEIFDWRDDLTLESRSPTTNEEGTLRPHVVWFGEMPLYMEEIYEALSDADLFISIGTSGNVYPAAGFVQEARMHGAHTIELNLEPSEGATLFTEKRYGPASEIVPAYVEELLGGV